MTHADRVDRGVLALLARETTVDRVAFAPHVERVESRTSRTVDRRRRQRGSSPAL
jgi:hypothetical protein